VAHEGQQIGLLTERLHAVSSFDEAQLSGLPIRAEFDLVQAIVREAGGLVQLLDVEALFRLFREPDRAARLVPAEIEMLDPEDADEQKIA
jgi:chemotaxis signal transduction protein